MSSFVGVSNFKQDISSIENTNILKKLTNSLSATELIEENNYISKHIN